MDVFNALLPIFTEYGYLAVFVMLLVCGFGVPVPEDVTLVTGGVIAGMGYADVHTMFAVGMAGVLIGDGLVFTLGRFQGERVMRAPGFRKVLTPERFQAAQGAFAKYGRWVMFVARFLPGLRTPVFFAAGMSRRVSFFTWLLMDGVAALISVPIWVYLGYFGARNWDWMWRMVHSFQYGIFGLLGLGLLAGGVVWWRRRRRQRCGSGEGA
ncbi:DedA family protein [Ideonella livida]|uniref:DedA family protein n=1 Tax=Ideonella livida TaxID=2707176 RepID=A0A7C9PG25_9BURK|nr:DedA family protein [Ideonella livida]NDY90975.1 DedA family protein [Ideonella livida]